MSRLIDLAVDLVIAACVIAAGFVIVARILEKL